MRRVTSPLNVGVAPRWVSLCCGLAATECRAMTGRFPPVARMGGNQRTWSRQKREVVTINFEPATEHAGAAKDRAAVRREMAPIDGPLFEGAAP